MLLTLEIDARNYQFTDTVKEELVELQRYSTSALEWLMLEHYQFSLKNTAFLALSQQVASQFSTPDVANELQDNLMEEKNHAAIYKKSLLKIGTDVEKRQHFAPTSDFFHQIEGLINHCPATTLGAMYATETAAIFEHEVFWEMSRELLTRRNLPFEGSQLKAFHDLHLNGVEQHHKDGLGYFVDAQSSEINKEKVLSGAMRAIYAMETWWKALLAVAKGKA